MHLFSVSYKATKCISFPRKLLLKNRIWDEKRINLFWFTMHWLRLRRLAPVLYSDIFTFPVINFRRQSRPDSLRLVKYWEQPLIWWSISFGPTISMFLNLWGCILTKKTWNGLVILVLFLTIFLYLVIEEYKKQYFYWSGKFWFWMFDFDGKFSKFWKSSKLFKFKLV